MWSPKISIKIRIKDVCKFKYPCEWNSIEVFICCASSIVNRIGGVMVSVLASSVVDRGFEHRSDQIKDYKNGIYCFSAKYAALRRKSKDGLARNHNNVSEWSDIMGVDWVGNLPRQGIWGHSTGPRSYRPFFFFCC